MQRDHEAKDEAARYKLSARGKVSEELGLDMEESKRLLLLNGSVRNALEAYKNQEK
mgnify:CR=1 FL=1